MQIYAIIPACSWFLGFFFLLLHVKINSCDRAEVILYRCIYDFKRLSLCMVALLQSGRKGLGVDSSLFHCLTLFFPPEVKTRLLLVLLQYTGWSFSPLAVIQENHSEYQVKFALHK